MMMTMVALFAATHAFAQQNYQKAFQKAIDNNEVTILSRKDYRDQPHEATTYCIFTEFAVSANKAVLVEQMETAFVKDQANAYSTYIMKPQSGIHGNYISYVYGPENEYSVQLGTKPSHNYYGACFVEPNDSLRRHAYCFVWYKEDKSYHCFYYHIYGLIPGKTGSSKNSWTSLSQEFGNKLDKAAKSSVRTIVNGNTVTIESISKDGIKDMSQVNLTDKDKPVSNDIEFMSQFGLLRAAFLDAIKDADNKVMIVGIATKIMTLCKEHGRLLVSQERLTCSNTLASMQKELTKTNPDEFVFGMLKQAQNYIEKK